MMQWSELKAQRQAAIDEMRENLHHTEPLGLPYWPLMLLMIPIFFGSLLYGILKIMWGVTLSWLRALIGIVAAPFLGLYLWCDLSVIAWWYFRQMVKRMSEEEK